MADGDSPFLAVSGSEWLAANDSAFVIADRFPVSPGHALVVPRRVVDTWWEATDAERADILALVDEVKHRLDAELQPDGYNVGFNSGAAAGQTIGHLHIHVIPRYRGDVPDSRGGVRHVIPGKGNYLLPPAEPYALIDGQNRLLRDDLLRCLRDRRFARGGPAGQLRDEVRTRTGPRRPGGRPGPGAKVRVLTTDYLTVTDPDALARLLDLAEVWPEAVATRVFQDPATSFHPKAYLFSSADGAAAQPSWAATTSAPQASRAASSGRSAPTGPRTCWPPSSVFGAIRAASHSPTTCLRTTVSAGARPRTRPVCRRNLWPLPRPRGRCSRRR